MKPDQYQKEYFKANFQLIVLDADGVIQECNRSFLPIEKGDLLSNRYPFFESLESLKSLPEKEHHFYCIHLSAEAQEFITDMKVTRLEHGSMILIQDLTTHYNSYQEVAQARNESIINEELILIKNAELEERERFKNLFIQNFSHELRNP
ncbi:MAG: hybrid sensor histidine kinase/response regulator, partial [Eudoraea sp.]|nr:hybrid sensor histidine kinase/response regulator [Eudoraea sp.]